MKKMFIYLITVVCIGIVVGCDLWMIGSEKTGYKIEIETDQIDYGDLQRIEQFLNNDGNKTIFREHSIEEHGIPRYRGKFYSISQKP
jgi:membrane protein DedA with SNARE-associated domain